jgi:hypothetical protein
MRVEIDPMETMVVLTKNLPRKVEMTAMTAMVALVIRDLMGDRRTMVTVRLELEGRMKMKMRSRVS